MEQRHIFLIVALVVASILVLPSVYSIFSGQHTMNDPGSINCLKCHPDIKQELGLSSHHTYFSCGNCHNLDPLSNQTHSAKRAECLDCHASPTRLVTDIDNNTYMTPLATVFGENVVNAESHNPFVTGAVLSSLKEGKNEACVACHSSLNNDIIFTRPEYIEYDVVNLGDWVIQNLSIGPAKKVNVSRDIDGRLHIIPNVGDVSCVSCHQDIQQAVLNGGHSFEQERRKHDPDNSVYRNSINDYCRSCHKPLTRDNNDVSPFPANPFNLPIHGSMTIACMDCHGRSGDIFVDINGGMRSPPYNSINMGSIENSINSQPAQIRSYFCIACKNTGNPVPINSLHFKIYTEPQVIVYVNGTQQYP